MIFSDAGYRLHRMRRLLVLGSLLPVLGLLVGAQLSGTAWALTGPAPLGVFGLMTVLLSLLVITFPNSALEANALSLGLALTLCLVPLIDTKEQLVTLFLFVPGLWVYAAVYVLLAWLIASFALVPAIALLDKLPAGQSQVRAVVHDRLDPQTAFAALTLRPNEKTSDRETGTPDKDGFFDVRVFYDGPDPESFVLTRQSYGYRVRIVESGPLRQVTATVLAYNGRTTTSVNEIQVSEMPGGCRCESREVQDHLTVLSRMNFWLTDFSADYLTAALDDAAGRPTRAISRLPQISVLARIAGAMRRDTSADPET